VNYIAVINLGINNLRSIVGAVNHLGYKTVVTNDKKKIMDSSALILPGVGSFPAGMNKIKKNNLSNIIKTYFEKKKPILAVCLGFQMLFNSSSEFKFTKGLNFLNGKVKSLRSLKTKRAVPNLGWYNINIQKKKGNCLFKNININKPVYFIHSYYAEVQQKKYISSYINFSGKKIATSIQFKNLYGVQFHPEKSGEIGLQIIKNFLEATNK
jgi:glutamine amidotransferase